ncbi:MAG: PilZ domain-containing protein [Halioglobus sp.]
MIDTEQDSSDRRRHERKNVVHDIYVEVAKRGVRSEAHTTIFKCETVDVSSSGLKLISPQDIAIGATLNVAVPMQNWQDSLEFIALVKWSQELEEKDGFWIGLELQQESEEKTVNWLNVVKQLAEAGEQMAAASQSTYIEEITYD